MIAVMIGFVVASVGLVCTVLLTVWDSMLRSRVLQNLIDWSSFVTVAGCLIMVVAAMVAMAGK